MPIEEVHANASRALQQIADKLATARKILVVTGAGISTSSGIPDFRSKDGLYSLIANDYQKGHKTQQASSTASIIKNVKGRDLFDVSVWNSAETTTTFLRFMAGFRGSCRSAQPTATHRFIKLLRDQRRLVRNYTQNIDGLETRVGLHTNLADGKGSRSRFTKKALALPSDTLPGGALHGGCETVQLHGDLASLRCSICQKLFPWEEDSRHDDLAQGMAPECPACAETDMIRRIAGRRGTRVGILRPNVVLYGEENQAADLIGPLVTSDIASAPDLLLIFGTSLKVHGLQKVVREFANAVHARKNGAGRVVFINHTPPAGSTWKDTIDIHVSMDCDAFVRAMRRLRPDIWTRQVALPYTMGHGGKTQKAKGAEEAMGDKENLVYDCPVKLPIVQAVSPKKQRRVLGDVTVLPPQTTAKRRRDDGDSEANRGLAVSTPQKKRKHADFDVYQEEPIIVESPSAVRTLKAVMAPLPKNSSRSSIQASKRVRRT